MAWTNTLSTVTPAGTDSPRGGDDRIRELKAAFIERLNVDGYWPTDANQVSDTNAGKHRKVTFYGVLSAKPTLLAGECAIYSKTVSGTSELFFEDSDGTEKQLTSGGTLNVANADLALITAFTLAVNFPAGLTVGTNTDIGDYNLRAKTLQSDVATGTAPLTVASTTAVTNLNADSVDGYHPGTMLGSISTVDSNGSALAETSVYRAPCDGNVGWNDQLPSGESTTGEVGTANPPDTTVAYYYNSSLSTRSDARSFRVAKNDYFRITTSSSPVGTIWWRPDISGGGNPVKQA